MSTIEDDGDSDAAGTGPITDWDVLAKSLPEKGIARALLMAWIEGDASGRPNRLLKVAQPTHVISEAGDDASQD
ncbi:MAG: hypothetical protein EON93_03690 [Burkholderiales bacterium]|nr:MAG: hypothetical protein EON93_03690 [Burkholderiales bacterium]